MGMMCYIIDVFIYHFFLVMISYFSYPSLNKNRNLSCDYICGGILLFFQLVEFVFFYCFLAQGLILFFNFIWQYLSIKGVSGGSWFLIMPDGE